MGSARIDSTLLICLLAAGMLMYTCKPSAEVGVTSVLPCGFNAALWRLDTCGTNGYKEKIGDCIFNASQDKPVFKTKAEVLDLLGRPDTVFESDEGSTLIYVTSGSYAYNCYNDAMLKTLSFWVNAKEEIVSVSGAIH